jgi:hypothetical protein
MSSSWKLILSLSLQPIFLSFYLNSGNECLPIPGDDVIEEHEVPETDPLQPELRARLNTNPSMSRPQTRPEARRVFSLHPGEKSTDTRSPQWVHATQTVLRALRLRQSLTGSSSEQSEQRQRQERLSSRLTSHHSSSSEEWYSEMQLLSESSEAPPPPQPDDRLSIRSVSEPKLVEVSPGNEIEAAIKESAAGARDLANGEEGDVSGVSDAADVTQQKDHKRRKRCCSRCNMT